MIGATKCPICGRALRRRVDYCGPADQVEVKCRHCGIFRVTGSAWSQMDNSSLPSQRQAPAFAYAIRRLAARQRRHQPPLVTTDLVNQWWNHPELPTPREAADNLILWLGDRTRSAPGRGLDITHDDHGAIIGAADAPSLDYVLHGLERQGVIEREGRSLQSGWRLTFEGWDRYESLRRGSAEGTTAFMAMKFGDADADRMYHECFKPTVADTGFRLIRLDDEPRIGLIDDSLRLAIKRARFVIADLTHANNGAYWEAGYAEGLGKPVIYTCRKDVFDSQGTHFDTNHHQTVLWRIDEPEEAARRLKATIRISLPEAKQED